MHHHSQSTSLTAAKAVGHRHVTLQFWKPIMGDYFMRKLTMQEIRFVSGGGDTVVVKREPPRDELGLLMFERHLIDEQQKAELIEANK